MLDALAAGERDPKVLAQLARGRMRVKIARIEEALDCSFFTPALAGLLARMLAMADQMTAQIEDLDAEIARLCAPFEAEIARLDEAGGIARRTAGDVIAGTGVNMGVFATARYKRLIRRMLKKKALAAAGNSMLTLIWHLLADPDATYHDLGADSCELRDPARQKRNYIRGLQRLGYHVTIDAINPATGELTPAVA